MYCVQWGQKMEITEIFKGHIDAGNVGLLCSWRFSWLNEQSSAKGKLHSVDILIGFAYCVSLLSVSLIMMMVT